MDDFLLTSTFATAITQPYELVVVARFRSGSGSRRIGSINLNGANGTLGSSSSSLWYVSAGTVLASTLSVGTVSRFIRGLLDGAGSSITVDDTTTAGNAGASNSTKVSLGAETTGGNPGPVTIASFWLKASALTAGERTDMKTWASDLYGVA